MEEIMGKFVKLKLDKDIKMEEFLDFLNFHQFSFETEEEELFNFNTMINEKAINFLIPEEKIEEFKVMTLIYKDLQSSKQERNLNIPIENSSIDYEKTRKINVVELAKDQKKDDKVFVKDEEKNSDLNSMEDSFYGNKKRKKNEKKATVAFIDEEVEEDIDLKEPKRQKSKSGKFIVDSLKIILLLGIIAILAFIFLLIR